MATLSSCGRYIILHPTKKLINPSYNAGISNYIGPIEDYEFRHQKKNFEAIQEKLGDNPLTFIYEGKFMGDRRPKISFIAHNADCTFFWRKYEAKSEGSGHNKIFIVNEMGVTSENLVNYLSND